MAKKGKKERRNHNEKSGFYILWRFSCSHFNKTQIYPIRSVRELSKFATSPCCVALEWATKKIQRKYVSRHLLFDLHCWKPYTWIYTASIYRFICIVWKMSSLHSAKKQCSHTFWLAPFSIWLPQKIHRWRNISKKLNELPLRYSFLFCCCVTFLASSKLLSTLFGCTSDASHPTSFPLFFFFFLFTCHR